MLPILMRLDPGYAQRVTESEEEKERWMRREQSQEQAEAAEMMRFLVSFRNQMTLASASETYEVTGAGNAEVNGVYVPANLATYVGPPLYNKRGTDIYLFRWQQRTWVVATLGRDLSRFSEPGNRYYTAPSGTPAVATPPPSGWSPPQGGRGVNPAPSAIHLPPPAICLV